MNNRTEVKQLQWHKQRTWRCGPRSLCPRGHAPCPRRDLPQFHCPSPPCPAWGWGGGEAPRTWSYIAEKILRVATGSYRKPKVKTLTWRELAGLEEEKRKERKLIEIIWNEIQVYGYTLSDSMLTWTGWGSSCLKKRLAKSQEKKHFFKGKSIFIRLGRAIVQGEIY